MDDHIPDDFDVIDEGDTLDTPNSFQTPQKHHFDGISILEIFLKDINRLIKSDVRLDDITVTINRQKRPLDTLIINMGLLTTNDIVKNLHDNQRERSDRLCRDFCASSDRRQHIRGETPYIVFFTPEQEPEIRENTRGVITGNIAECPVKQRLLFPYDHHYPLKGLSPEAIPKQTFAALATPSITLDKNDNVLFVNWHAQSPDHIDLDNISGKIAPSLFTNQISRTPSHVNTSQP